MFTKNWIIVLLLITIIGIVSWFFFFRDIENEMIDDELDAMIEEEMTLDEEVDSAMEDAGMEQGGEMEGIVTAGSYEAYAPEKLARANDGDVVLFFRAVWCPTCRALDANIRANLSNIPADLTILDVDYDNSTPLKQKYGITYQHTLVQVNADGSQISKWSGSPTLAELVSKVQ